MKWGIVLKEKEACTGRELGPVVKESLGLLKGSWVLDQRHLEDGPVKARPASEKAHVAVETVGCFLSSLKTKPIWMALKVEVSK